MKVNKDRWHNAIRVGHKLFPLPFFPPFLKEGYGFLWQQLQHGPQLVGHQSCPPGLAPPGSAGLAVCPGWQESAVASGNVTVGGNAVTGEEAAAAVEAGGLKKQPSQGGRHGKEKAMKMT